MSQSKVLATVRKRVEGLERNYTAEKARGSAPECYEWASGRRLIGPQELDEIFMAFDNDLDATLRLIKDHLRSSSELRRLDPVMGHEDDGKRAIYLLLHTD